MFYKSRKKISFVVIAYNREQYIEECIDSILKQDIEKEIICVDDCSTDKTYEILQKYANEYREIKIYRNETNRGTVYTRCEGISKCTGKYMLFVDADDKLIGSYNELYEVAKKEKADILEFSSDTDGNENFKKYLKRNNRIIDGELLTEYSNRNISNQLWNKLVSKKVYKRVVKLINPNLKQANFSDVVYFMYHFLKNSNKLVSTELIGYFYYDTRGMTANVSVKERLKEYCGFKSTKQELEYVYGKMPELKKTWNYICNQAVDTYLKMNEEEQKKNKHILYELMSEKDAEHLINEISKIKNKYN